MKNRAIRLATVFLITAVWFIIMSLFGIAIDLFVMFIVGSIFDVFRLLIFHSLDVEKVTIPTATMLAPLVKSILPIWLITFIHIETKRKECMEQDEFVEHQIFFIAVNIIAMYVLFWYTYMK